MPFRNLRMDNGRAVLLFFLVTYLIYWVIGNHEMLFDPMLHNNDVRTHLYSFHKYGENKAFSNDPVTAEVVNMVTPGVRILYRIIVPLTNLQVATKIVQGICFLIILLSFLLVARRGGVYLAGASLLLFFVLHTEFLTFRTVGGFQRSFAIPTIVLWVAGSFIRSLPIRISAILLGAVTYPTSMALLMASEFFFRVTQLNWKDNHILRTQILREIKSYIALTVACVLALTPYMMMKRHAGPPYSLHEAQNEPAFRENGRVNALPFSNPVPEMISSFLHPLRPPHAVVNFLRQRLNPILIGLAAFGVIFLIAYVILTKAIVIPVPKIGLSLFFASISVYIVARIFAFHLYWPKRYYEFGLPLAFISIVVEVVPQLNLPNLSISRYWLTTIIIVTSLILLGPGITPRIGVGIDGNSHLELYKFFRNTPENTRVACHPYDGDDLPFWAGRPTTGGFETLQPWFVDSWQRHKALTEEVLTALYATDWKTVVSFCQNHNITHLLLNVDRYGSNFYSEATMFEPFGSYLQTLLDSVDRDDLVLVEAINNGAVFRDDPFVVIDVQSLFYPQPGETRTWATSSER